MSTKPNPKKLNRNKIEVETIYIRGITPNQFVAKYCGEDRNVQRGVDHDNKPEKDVMVKESDAVGQSDKK